MSEDTKEEAHAGSFGLKLRFTSSGIERAELADLIVEAVRSTGVSIGNKRKFLIGHVKAFTSVPGGSLQVNLVDLDLGPEKDDRLPEGAITNGEVRFMAAVVGLSDHELEEILEGALEPLEERLELDIKEHKHEH